MRPTWFGGQGKFQPWKTMSITGPSTHSARVSPQTYRASVSQWQDFWSVVSAWHSAQDWFGGAVPTGLCGTLSSSTAHPILLPPTGVHTPFRTVVLSQDLLLLSLAQAVETSRPIWKIPIPGLTCSYAHIILWKIPMPDTVVTESRQLLEPTSTVLFDEHGPNPSL